MMHTKRGSIAISVLLHVISYAAASEAAAEMDNLQKLFIEQDVIPDVVDVAPKQLAKVK